MTFSTSNHNSFISGDQSPNWDALLKLIVCSRRGYHVTHALHAVDLFSRPAPTAKAAVAVTHEAYRVDGNVTRWTASLESCPFLGQMPLHPNKFTSHGVKFNQLAQWRDQPIEEIVASLTQGDWLGLSYQSEDQIAFGLPLSAIVSHLPALRRPIRTNLSDTVGPAYASAALRWFDQLFYFNSGPNARWETTGLRIMQTILDQFDCPNIKLTTHLSCTPPHAPKLLQIFLHHYESAWKAYNQAAQEFPGEIPPLRPRELPFYAIVKDHQGMFRRKELTYQIGNTLDSLCQSVAAHGQVQAILGKAIPHLIELLLSGPVLLPELGSPFTTQALRCAHYLQLQTGQILKLHPVWRLHFHALDALAAVSMSFKLPAYLQKAFGQEWISGHQFAAQWRNVVTSATQDVQQLANADHNQLPILLKSQGLFTKDLHALLNTIGTFHQSSHLQANRCSLNRYFSQRLWKFFQAGLEHQRAQALRQSLATATSLPYWDCRPFAHWVLAIPGWLEEICKIATFSIDPASSSR